MISGKHIHVLNQEKDNGDINRERKLNMNESKSETKDPVCGMTVDTAIVRRFTFAASTAGTKPEDKKGGCCG